MQNSLALLLSTQNQNERLTTVRREMLRYESFSLSSKAVNILYWWRDHEKVLPCLARLAKHVLTIPASSAKSERVFSTGGNFVTAKRNRVALKKVKDLIKENKAKIEAFKIRGVYDLVNVGSEPFVKISVDEVLANLVIEDENDTDNVEQDHEDYEEEVLFVEDYDSDDDYESEEDANTDEIIDLM